MSTPAGLYDWDFYTWTLKNTKQICQGGRRVEVDLEHVEKEVESIDRSELHSPSGLRRWRSVVSGSGKSGGREVTKQSCRSLYNPTQCLSGCVSRQNSNRSTKKH